MAEGRLVGPFPEGSDHEEYDRRRRRVLWKMPSGLYVLGSGTGRRRNLMTLNWATQVATEPKLVAVSVEKGAVTHDLIEATPSFSLNVLRRADRAVVRKFVKPLNDEGDPSSLGGVAVRVARTGAPIMEMALAWMDCLVVQPVDCGSHTLFVGEIVDCDQGDAGVDGEEVLRMEDTRMSYGG